MKANKRWGMLWQKLDDSMQEYMTEASVHEARGETDKRDRVVTSAGMFSVVKSWMIEMERQTQ